jgi:opacity protein-like surface antigen
LFFLSRRTYRHLPKKHVAITKAIKRAIIIIVFAAAATSLSAQDITPEESTSGEGENPSETTPTAPPIVPTNPADGSVRLGVGGIAPIFYLGRRFQLSTSFTGGYDDNVNSRPTGSPSWYASPSAVFTYQFGNPRLAMNLIAGAGIIYYFAHPGGRDFDPNVYLRLSLAYKASERLTFHVSAFAAYQAQPDVTSALSANRRLGNFFRSEDNISADYRWTPRFSTITSYTFSALEYQNSSSSRNDRLENHLGEQVRYLLFPTTTATAGYRIGITDYQTTGHNHLNQTLTAGLDQTFGPDLRGTFQGGLQLRSGQISPYFDAGLHYTFGSRTQVFWTNRYSIEESGTGAGSGRETFRTNLLLNYRVTARISANLNVSYQNGTGGQGASGAEDVFDVSPGVRYAITPSLAVNAGYHYTELDRGSKSATASQLLGYTRNRYFAGLTFRF